MTIQPHQRNSVATFDPDEALHFLGYDLDNPAAQAVLALCQRYELDPFANHIMVLPGRPYPYVTRDGHLWLAHRSGQFDGMEVLEQWADDKNAYAKVAVWHKGMSHAFTYTGRAPLKVTRRGQPGWDEHADKKAVANAEVRALKRAFPLQLPSVIDLEDSEASETDGPRGGPPALGPSPTSGTDEHVTRAGGQVASGSASASRAPVPDTTPGEEQRVHSTPTEVSSDQSVAVTSSPGPMSSGTAARGVSQIAVPEDSTSPPPVIDPGKVGRGGDTNVRAGAREVGAAGPDANPTTVDPEGGDAVAKATDRQTGSAVRGAQQDGEAAADPDQSLTLVWCGERGINPRHARLHLAKAHSDKFGDLRDWRDLAELKDERAAQAILLLDVWLNEQQQEGG